MSNTGVLICIKCHAQYKAHLCNQIDKVDCTWDGSELIPCVHPEYK